MLQKGGLVLITVWVVEEEDRSLVSKWTPLAEKYVEEWIGPGSLRARTPLSVTLECILEYELSSSGEHIKVLKECSIEDIQKPNLTNKSQNSVEVKDEKNMKNQQEYFVPWHLPYHHAEISGAFAHALADGLAIKDDKKGAVVYKRYYHVFSEGELCHDPPLGWIETGALESSSL